jgi:hypothetical protein
MIDYKLCARQLREHLPGTNYNLRYYIINVRMLMILDSIH